MNAVPRARYWQLQDAKARLSEVIRCTTLAPQFITVRGEGVAVIISLEYYQKLTEPKPNLYEFIHESPLCGAEADVVFDAIENDKQFLEEPNFDL
jgi:prevent-host-death family protein